MKLELVDRGWLELDPEGAVREVRAQFASPNAALSAHSVGLLPGGPQPQFEQEWAREFVESDDDDHQTVLAALLVDSAPARQSRRSKAKRIPL